MSERDEKDEQLEVAITAFELSLTNLPAKETNDYEKRFLEALNARVAVARIISGMYPVKYDALTRLLEADRRLKAEVKRIEEVVGLDNMTSWREALQSPAIGWWWSLEKYGDTRKSVLWTLVTMVSIVVSLALLLEITLRFFASGTDFLSASELLLALLTGGTLAEAGRRIVQRTLDHLQVKRGRQPTLKLALALALLVGASALKLSLPTLAKSYNNEGARLLSAGQHTAALKEFRRAVNLNPTYAAALYNLASTYEDLAEYDMAMAGYRQAIESDGRMYFAYNNLARLYVIHKNEPALAISLLNKALEIADALPEPERHQSEYKIYKNRGWAHLEAKMPGTAEEDLRQALELQPDGAAAHCLLAQVLEGRGKQASGQEVKEAWGACLANAAGQEQDLDLRWLEMAQERLSR
jgi:tetratricopeptide (TPR) repeat protein